MSELQGSEDVSVFPIKLNILNYNDLFYLLRQSHWHITTDVNFWPKWNNIFAHIKLMYYQSRARKLNVLGNLCFLVADFPSVSIRFFKILQELKDSLKYYFFTSRIPDFPGLDNYLWTKDSWKRIKWYIPYTLILAFMKKMLWAWAKSKYLVMVPPNSHLFIHYVDKQKVWFLFSNGY